MSLILQKKNLNIEFKYIGFIFDGKKVLRRSISVPLLSAKNSQFAHQNIFCSNCRKNELFLGQRLPTEDRVTEYKRGSGNYLNTSFITHVRKYVCAFLNSEGGRLLVGVGDDCTVYGISCTRKQEDQTRCQIDHVIQNFYPHVLPHLYTVKFIPVKLAFDESIELHKNDPLLKVLEVSVLRPNLPKNLYVNDKDEIYIRRDGSVEGPLKAPQIVEWCKSNCSYKYNEDDPMDTEFNGDKLPHAETYEKLREGLMKFHKSTERQIKYLQQSSEIEKEIYKRKKLKAKDDIVSSKANQLHPNSQSSCTLL